MPEVLERVEFYHFGHRCLPLLPVAHMTERPVWWFKNKQEGGRPSHRSVGRKMVLQLDPILSLTEVAELMGCSDQQVANIEMVALGKLAETMRTGKPCECRICVRDRKEAAE